MSGGEHDDEQYNAASSLESSGLERAIQKTLCFTGSFASKTQENMNAPGVVGWMRKLALLMCSWVILIVIQRSREQPIWNEIQLLHSNVQDITRSKQMSVKLTKGLQAEEAVMQKIWKELQDQVATVQQVQKEFDNLRQKNVDFQDHLTTVLKDLSSGISDLKQRALPVNGESQAKFEKSHFPVLWNAILNLEGRVKDIKVQSDPLLAKNLQHQVEKLKDELYASNERLEEVRHQSKRERIQAMKDSMSAMKEELAEAGINHGPGHVLTNQADRGETQVLHSHSFIDRDSMLDESERRRPAVYEDATSQSSMVQQNNQPGEQLPFDRSQPNRASLAGQYGEASASSLAEQKSISVRVVPEDVAMGAKAVLHKIDLKADVPDKKSSPTFLNK